MNTNEQMEGHMRASSIFEVKNYEGTTFRVEAETWPGERCALIVQTLEGEHVQTILGVDREQAERRLREARYEWPL